MQREKNSVTGWLILAVFLLFIGSLAIYSTVGAHVVSNAEYMQLSGAEQLTVMSQDSFAVSYYGGIGFFVAGLAFIGLAVFLRLKG